MKLLSRWDRSGGPLCGAVVGVVVLCWRRRVDATVGGSAPIGPPDGDHYRHRPEASARARHATRRVRILGAAEHPTVVLQAHGSGIQNTTQFTTGGNWTLNYTYDCSSFGSSGNFIVSDETGMPLVNEMNDKGSGSTPQYDAGTGHAR